MKKTARSACNSNNPTGALSQNHHTLNMQAQGLYAYSLCITQNIKETFIQELRLNKTDFLLVKMFLSETFF